MERTDVLTKYELVIILDSKLGNDQKEQAVASACDAIKKVGGKVINSQVWLEKQKMTFSIKKRAEGTYYLVNFEAEGTQANDLKPALRLNEDILRFVIIKAN